MDEDNSGLVPDFTNDEKMWKDKSGKPTKLFYQVSIDLRSNVKGLHHNTSNGSSSSRRAKSSQALKEDDFITAVTTARVTV